MLDIFFSFKGRISRLNYWLYNILLFVLFIAIGIVASVVIPGTVAPQEGMGTAKQAVHAAPNPIGLILMLALIVVEVWASLAIQVKRWHDLDKSGWWALTSLIPYVNFVVFIILGFVKGTEGENRFGPDPLERDEAAVPNEAPSASRSPSAGSRPQNQG